MSLCLSDWAAKKLMEKLGAIAVQTNLGAFGANTPKPVPGMRFGDFASHTGEHYLLRCFKNTSKVMLVGNWPPLRQLKRSVTPERRLGC